jgi:hypothetical protein
LIIANRLYAFHNLTGEVSPAGRALSELRFCVGAVRERRKRFELRGERLEARGEMSNVKAQMSNNGYRTRITGMSHGHVLLPSAVLMITTRNTNPIL